MIKEYLRKKILEIGEEYEYFCDNIRNCKHCKHYQLIADSNETNNGMVIDKCHKPYLYGMPSERQWRVCNNFKLDAKYKNWRRNIK